jgi:hypothetical protein
MEVMTKRRMDEAEKVVAVVAEVQALLAQVLVLRKKN